MIYLYVFNVGAETGESPVITDTLPPGIMTASTPTLGLYDNNGELGSGEEGGSCTVTGASHVVTCTEAHVPSGYMMEIAIPVTVEGVAQGAEEVNRATVVGGGALGPASQVKQVRFSASPAGFGFAGVDAWATSADGRPATQAGSHPYEVTVAYAMNSKGFGYSFELPTGGETHDLVVNLPPGIVGNPTAVPRCTRQEFDGENSPFLEKPACSPATQIGVDVARPQGLALSFKVYNLVPPPGVAAQFGFLYDGIPVLLDAGVRSGGSTPQSRDYGIGVHADNLPQRSVVFNATTIWGVPAEASHNLQRRLGLAEAHEPGLPSDAGRTPFMTLPTSCEGPQEFSLEVQNTWESEGTHASASVSTQDENGSPLGFTGCDHLGFQPTISVAPDTSHADTPAGLTVNVEAPEQALNAPEGIVTSNIKNTTVALPQGMVINPGQAAGLAACPASEDGTDGEGPPTCPAASKVGTVEIETPLLFDKLQGNIYIMHSNPPELQLLVAASGDGVNLKLIGDVHLDEATGQLVTTFSETPELPFTDFKLSFSGGAQAALATPTLCGTYQTVSDFMPWSAPLVGDAFPTSHFVVESGPGGGPCTSSLPFTPSLIAGATTDQAGGYTNFSLLLQRGDGQQRISALQFKAPAGLTGELSKVPLCTNAQAEANACPEASKIGHTVVESGPGPYPLVVPEPGQPPAPIYLTEAYDGAPFGLSIVVPLQVGPFTLPTQRVRAKIEVDPQSAALTITTGALPQEIAGIPTDLREVDAVIERPEFMVNPTNCDSQSFSGTAYGAPAPGVSEAPKSASIESHFQVGACRSLAFTPKFSVSTSGRTSRANGAGLVAKVSYPRASQGAQADLGRFKVSLPKQLPSRLTTLQKACVAATFEANPANCPAASVVGHAVVHTPLLSVPVEGPAYFVSHGNEAFPSLEIVLQGEGVTVELVGSTFISKAGITSTTFNSTPDVPFSSFELRLPEGQYSALAANGNLCAGKLAMPTVITGQNGAVIEKSTPISVTGCQKAKALTRTQKLVKALKACKKNRMKSKLASCEKQAREKYRTLKSKRK